MANKIEIATSKERFSESEVRALVRESKAFWSSPAGKRRKAQLDRESRSRKPAPTKFPELAKRTGTRPALSPAQAEVQNWKARFGGR